MSLPHLIKYIYSNGSDEVIRRGKKIYATGYIEIIRQDDASDTLTCRVKDDLYGTWYKVYVSKFSDQEEISLRCTCPYNIGDICRHETATLFYLQDLLEISNARQHNGVYDQQHTVVNMRNIDLRQIRNFASPQTITDAEEYLRSKTANILEAAKEKVVAEITQSGEKYTVSIARNDQKNFETSCNCRTENKYPLCLHKTILLIQLLHNFGANYFDSIRNWDREKNKLLTLYGYSLNDDLDGKFEFTYKNGKPFLRVLDPGIARVEQQQKLPEVLPQQPKPEKEDTAEQQNYKLGVVISNNPALYPFLQLSLLKGLVNEDGSAFVDRVEKLDLTKYIDISTLDDHDRQLVQQVRKILPSEVTKFLNRNSPFSGIWENIIHHHDSDLPEETRKLIVEYLLPKYKKIFSHTSHSYLTFYLPVGKPINSKTIELANYSVNFVKPSFRVKASDDGYELVCEVETPLDTYLLGDNESQHRFMFHVENQFFLWKSVDDVLLVEKFPASGKIFFSAEDWEKELNDFILPLSQHYKIDFSEFPTEELFDVEPEARINLKESGDYLVFEPQFIYQNEVVNSNRKDKIINTKDGKLKIIHRNKLAEDNFIGKIASLHTSFVRFEKNNNLALKGTEVLKDNWFFLFLDLAKQMKVPVYGFEGLKKYKFNRDKVSTKIFISSHTDWFDAKVDVSFGDQHVTIEEIKKALANNQTLIPLQDGTLGVLPEDWMKKYSLLFQVGNGSQQELKINKYHFSLIDELYALRNDEDINFELEEKFQRIKENHTIANATPPAHLSNILRPYQTFGFNWLNYLNGIGWGGILADDMGLGKTIQALSFLYHLKTENGTLKALVVCPTTLMYNWENEIKKFAPEIKYHIHHGTNRHTGRLLDERVELIITTYGTVRSDIKHLSEVKFDYIILDESQAIKNPASKITKAASLLKANNRLCLSGTPLQNNTFDIYAQMNFLNPGLLGSAEWFRQNFAIPIDKLGEADKKENLRKLIYPFILRRTKEQVAKDLPEKTESILYLEMDKKQRKIYDAYRNDYRDKILGMIEGQGIQRSQLTVLQGLMKLRQICDSPAILKEENYPNYSVKIEELSKEIEENVGDHKVLIFSQFLGMLALIREKLKSLDIKFEYFDGSTSVNDREKAIQSFQNDEACRVFLISLKAGGVGLNLTAADYVYIVDPWWNPAVEQQAIDRTHRIGQTKNIFAYRMICKDTVEDKILQLQDKKRALATELISNESGFVKSLSKEDIEYLFS